MKRNNKTGLHFDNFPFHLGMQDSPQVLNFPASLPFTLTFNKRLGLIVQQANPRVNSWLNKGYEFGAPGSTPLDKGSFSQKRSEAIVKALISSLGPRGVIGRSFLEIGCGSGYLLYLLKRNGAARCLGVEPNPVANLGSKKYEIEIRRQFFEPSKMAEKFDVVFTTCVLEHINQPLTFLKGLKTCVKPGGILFTAVPDCELGLSIGDISLLAHLHVGYFTRRSLHQLYLKLGFDKIDFTTAGYGWLLYMWAKLPSKDHRPTSANAVDVAEEKKLFSHFARLIPNNMAAIQRTIRRLENQGKSVGVYGAYPFFLSFKWAHKPRFFDTDAAKYGKYFLGYDMPIENPRSLQTRPVGAIFVAPINYDEEIRSFLKKELHLAPRSIISLKSIYRS